MNISAVIDTDEPMYLVKLAFAVSSLPQTNCACGRVRSKCPSAGWLATASL